MSITKTTRSIRPSTDVPFFREAAKATLGTGTYPAFEAANTIFVDLIDSSKATQTITGEDGLTETRTWTFTDVDALSTAESASSIALSLEFQTYRIANNFTIQPYTDVNQRKNALEYAGINQPYKVTTTYTFPEGESYIDTFVSSVEAYEHYGKIHDLYINGNDVVVIHQYLNSEDQTTNPYLDMFYAAQLNAKNVTRTIKYELV